MKKVVLITAIVLILYGSKAFSQTNGSDSKKWAFETELVQPFIPEVGIIRVQATRSLTKKNDLIIGAYIRPNVEHDIVETINEYLFILGYRQYIWKGLHVEAKSNIGFAEGKMNKIDGKDYNNFSWFWEANAGYKIKLNQTFYVTPQFGVISSISSDIGPRGGKSDTFAQGSLLLGIKF